MQGWRAGLGTGEPCGSPAWPTMDEAIHRCTLLSKEYPSLGVSESFHSPRRQSRIAVLCSDEHMVPIYACVSTRNSASIRRGGGAAS